VRAHDPLTLGRAWELTDRLASSIGFACPELQVLEPAGDIRRSEPLVSSIVLVGSAIDPSDALAAIVPLFAAHEILEQTEYRITVGYRQAHVDIRFVTPDALGSVLFAATGSQAHVDQVVSEGLAARSFATEAQLYSSVGLTFVPPELRHGDVEVEAARAGRLPPLVDLADVRGDLHMHSTYSDGRDSVAAMAEGAHDLGYEYIAITDHSWGAAASRTLAIDSVSRQREEIERLRERFPRMAILHGVEVDILPDGRLDFPDSILEKFDIVLASLHDRAGHDAAALTRRSLAAIRHPLVNVLCHPANQLVGRHPGYALDFEALYGAALETGTALEIDGAPSHMDLDGARAREAIAAGAMLTIDSDCHRVEALGRQMRLGVGTARRGWVEPRHVLNTRPLADIREFVAAKRKAAGAP
jgi:DNA polymerase (family X)